MSARSAPRRAEDRAEGSCIGASLIRKHVETVTIGEDGSAGSGKRQEERHVRLGAWIGNQRSRAATLTPERIEQLAAIGMRWT
ncbi:helicase associated domain-containing protein [Streptomyces sp. NPDC014846]|uniref:helicase associated domain-containing protein n=1 Tax=Streptomyces sp. NPDC014846 TaxID=3364922 RepID=UPI0036FA0A55